MSNDIIVDDLAMVASSKMVWAFIVLQYLKFLARESHRWFATPEDRFNAAPPHGFDMGRDQSPPEDRYDDRSRADRGHGTVTVISDSDHERILATMRPGIAHGEAAKGRPRLTGDAAHS